MPQTTGDVQQINLLQSLQIACVYIGDAMTDAEIFLIQLQSTDSDSVLAFKKSMIAMLYKAKIAGNPVTVTHGESDAIITAVLLVSFNISPVGRAIRDDFYSVTGSGIPEGTEFVFESETGLLVTVPADMVRPHWAFLSHLPPEVPPGRNWVSLQAAGYASDEVPIDVFLDPPQRNRALYSGAPKGRPYTIVLLANPILEMESPGEFISDPIVADHEGYHDIVRFCLTNLLTVAETLLRHENMDADIRFVSICDPVFGENADDFSFVRQNPPNLIGPRQSKFDSYIRRYFEIADVAFAITGSTTHTRASAHFTQDNASGAATSFTYDGTNRVHRHFANVPGVATISRYSNQTGLTPLHEYGHMASDSNNGAVVDLYVDGGPGGFQVNKKFRADSADPVPADFANYDGDDYDSDPNRDGLGYPSNWRSYHPELISAQLPNLMDNYWFAPTVAQIQDCRLDELTFAWFTDRLRAKINR